MHDYVLLICNVTSMYHIMYIQTLHIYIHKLGVTLGKNNYTHLAVT